MDRGLAKFHGVGWNLAKVLSPAVGMDTIVLMET